MANGKILVVEDDEDLVHMLTYNLGKRGYQTATALDGMAASRVVETEKTGPDPVWTFCFPAWTDGKICKNHSQPPRRIYRRNPDHYAHRSRFLPMTDLKGWRSERMIISPNLFSIKEVMLKVDRFMGRENKRRFSERFKSKGLKAREDRRTDFSGHAVP